MNVLRLDRQNAEAFSKLGYIWFEEGSPMRAAPFLFRARDLDGKNYENRIKLAKVMMGGGAYAEARKDALAILGEVPGNGDALVLLTESDRSPEDLKETEAQLQKFPETNTVLYHLAQANVSLHKNDRAGAREALNAALAVDPKSSETHLALAVLSLIEKKKDEAVRELKTAADLAPVRSTEKIKFAEYLNESGAHDDAMAIVKDMYTKAPDYLPAWRLAAQIASQEKKYDEALGYLENVFSRDPDNFDARIVQGQLFLAKGEPKKAVDSLEHEDKVYANSAIVKFQLAVAYLQNNNKAQAASTLTDVLALQPDSVEAALLLGQINFQNGNLPPVIKSMTDLLQKQPANVQAQLLLAEAYRATGKLTEAADVYREQVKANPTNPQPLLLLGAILRQDKKNDEAREAFEKALALAPDNMAPVDQLVDLDLANRNFESAMKRAQEQLTKHPQLAGPHYMLAKVAATQGKWDIAEAEAQKTIDIDAGFSAAYDLLISCYIAQNKLQQAVSGLETLLAKTPDNPRALLVTALIYDKLGNVEKTRDAYEKLLALVPNSLLGLNNLAYIYADRLNQLDRASELARKARDLQPNDASTADTLGWILYKQGDYAQAKTLLEESALKQPDAADVQYHLGMARYMMGQVEPARAALEKAVSSTADFPGKKEAQERLTSLREHPDQVKAAPSQGAQPGADAQQPNDVVAHIRQAESFEKQKDYPKAVAEYELALKTNPKLTNVIVKLAQLNAGPLQNKTKAIDYAKKARSMAPADPKIAADLGAVAYQAGNYTWAYSLLQESARQITDNPTLLRNYAWAAYSVGRVAEANDSMQKIADSFAQAPEAADAKTFLSMTALQQDGKDILAAEPEANAVLKGDPQYVPALMVKAAIQAQRGETKAAVTTYGEVLSRFADFSPAQKELAALLIEDPAEVARTYELATKARKAMPDDPEVAQTLGVISYKKKEYSRALQLLQESNRKKPLEAKGLFYLGMSQAQAKQESVATDTLNQALSAGLKEPWAAEAKQKISDLQPKEPSPESKPTAGR